jgi:hypothetical protein
MVCNEITDKNYFLIRAKEYAKEEENIYFK